MLEAPAHLLPSSPRKLPVRECRTYIYICIDIYIHLYMYICIYIYDVGNGSIRHYCDAAGLWAVGLAGILELTHDLVLLPTFALFFQSDQA